MESFDQSVGQRGCISIPINFTSSAYRIKERYIYKNATHLKFGLVMASGLCKLDKGFRQMYGRNSTLL